MKQKKTLLKVFLGETEVFTLLLTGLSKTLIKHRAAPCFATGPGPVSLLGPLGSPELLPAGSKKKLIRLLSVSKVCFHKPFSVARLEIR